MYFYDGIYLKYFILKIQSGTFLLLMTYYLHDVKELKIVNEKLY